MWLLLVEKAETLCSLRAKCERAPPPPELSELGAPAATQGEACFSLGTSVPSDFCAPTFVTYSRTDVAKLKWVVSGLLASLDSCPAPAPAGQNCRGPTSFHRCSGMALMSTGWRSITFRNRTSGTAMAQITWIHLGGRVRGHG